MTDYLSKNDLIKTIANESHIRREVVALVLEKFTDIAIEEIVNKGAFRLENVFTVSEHEVKNLLVPTTEKSKGGIIPKTTRLSTRLSVTIKKLYKLQREFPNSPRLVNRDSWRDAVKWWDEGNRGPAHRKPEQIKTPAKTFELHNPYLDEDD